METAESPQPVEKELRTIDPVGEDLTELHSSLISSYFKIAKIYPQIDYNHTLKTADRMPSAPWPLDQKNARIQTLGEPNPYINVIWDRDDGMKERIALDYTNPDPIKHTEPSIYFTRQVYQDSPENMHESTTYLDGKYTKELDPQDPSKSGQSVTLTYEDWTKSEDRIQVLRMVESFKQIADHLPSPRKGILGRFKR